jgi:copper transport protein
VAWAHATLVRSDPAKDARVPWPPTVLRLEFSEAVAPATSRVELVSPDSQRLSLVVRADSSGNPKALLADVPALVVSGRYRVDWRLIGADGHAVTGQYSFTVDSVVRKIEVPSPAHSTLEGRSPEPGPPEPERPTTDAPLQVLLRFLSTLALLIVIGATVFSLFILPRVRAAGAERGGDLHRTVDGRLRSWARVGAWSMLVLAAVRLTSQAAVLSGSFRSLSVGDITAVLSSSWGRGWLLYVGATIAALIALRSSRRPSDRSPWSWAAAACVALALASPLIGHPAAADSASIAIGLDAVHVMAAGGWGGTLLILTLVAVPQAVSLRGDQRANALRSLLRAFTPLALTCAAVLLLTGATQAWLQIGSIPGLWNSRYGLALLRKLVLVMVVGALGAWHWRVAQPALGSDRSIATLRWSMALDVAALLGVIALTAILTGTATG